MTVGAIIAIVLVVGSLGGMAVSWALRGRRQRGIVLPVAPADPGRTVATAAGLYLGTAPAGKPLERIVAGGLGFRARANLAVTEAGLLVERAGSPALLIPVDALTGAGAATWTLDRAVERDGLTVIRWRLGETEVDSSFRLDPGGHTAVVDALAPAKNQQEVSHADDH